MLALLNRRVIRPLLARKSGSKVFRYLRLLEQTQFDPPDVIRARQFVELKRILNHAYDTVPFYRERFRSAGLHPSDVKSFADYEQLPVLTKSDLRNRGEELRSAAKLPGEVIRKETSGSTGVAVRVHLDQRGLEWKYACTLRSDQWSGWRIGQPVAKVWGNPEYKKHGLKGRLRNWLVDRAIHLDTLDVTDERLTQFTHELNRHRPGLLFGHAHSLYLLACHIKKRRLSVVKPGGIISTSMLLHQYQRAVIEEVFHTPVTNRYGCEEVSLIASECETHDGLHLNSDSVYCEATPGQGSTPMLVTDLSNYAMPLLRYQVGDMVVPASGGRCSCGRGLPMIRSIEGREADYVLTPTGRLVSGISLTENFALHIAGAEQVQIVQETTDFLRLRVVPGREFGDRSRRQISDMLAATFEGSMRHEVELVDAIPQERSGKYRFCISEVAREHMRAMSA